MIYDRILLRFGDLTLKGRNQKYFVDKLWHLVKLKLSGLNVKIEKMYNRFYILLNDCDHNEVIKRLDYVSGLYSYSLVCKCSSNLEEINALALKICQEEIKNNVTFKVEAKRADKRFPITSQDIAKKVAGYVLSNTNNLKVDVHNPEVTLNVEVREEGTYIFTNEIKGMGGFPVGVAGKGLVMMSGGIDSPVAAYLAMKQGIEVEVIHFESTPLTSIESAQKVVDLCKKLALYSPNNHIKIHMVPFMEMHQALLNNVEESYNITIMRRMMYRIATEIARRRSILCLINGESVGQVASQTLESMNVINSVTNIPVLRPVCTYDKLDIIKISKKIDTFDISIKPFEDCCTVYVPKNPATKPNLEKCLKIEESFDYMDIINRIVDETKSINVRYDSDLDLPMLGLVVKSVI